ncbi:MAG: DNA polymerase IV [Erysipelotrichaceae bacterium]|nr:DNA polymerase IV [Erysipelotrichaceae bacterium]
MSKVIMHIDLNAFFVTCETMRDPSLKGKPVIVGHAGRSGIVSTCSYEARAFGVHSGQPTFQALKLCPDAIIVEPHFHDYEVYSRSFFSYVRRYTQTIEVASIDECYADMTKALSGVKDVVAYLRKMQFDLKNETGLSCSIGIAPTKWLAKMASDMKKPMGLVFLRRRDIPKILYPMPIESFWGIGKKTAPYLRSVGIDTIGDLAKATERDDPLLQRELGKFYSTVKDWVAGRGSDIVNTEEWDPKSVGVSETLMYDSKGYAEIQKTLHDICLEVSRRAKKEGKVGRGVTLHVKDTAFKLHSKASTFDAPTDDPETLFSRVSALYKANYEDMEVRLIGVTLEKLGVLAHEEVQMSLWNYEQYEEMDKTKLLIAELNRKLDKPSIIRGSEAKKGKKDA